MGLEIYGRYIWCSIGVLIAKYLSHGNPVVIVEHRAKVTSNGNSWSEISVEYKYPTSSKEDSTLFLVQEGLYEETRKQRRRIGFCEGQSYASLNRAKKSRESFNGSCEVLHRAHRECNPVGKACQAFRAGIESSLGRSPSWKSNSLNSLAMQLSVRNPELCWCN